MSVYLSETQALGVYDVKDYLAVGNGVADDTAAIQAAIDAANAAGGGTVAFPVGTYVCNGTLSMNGYARVRLVGQGNPSHLGGAAVLRYTGTAATFISCGSSFVVQFRNLRVEYTSASFTGDLVGFGWYNGGVAPNADPTFPTFEDCVFSGSASVFGGRSGIQLDRAQLGTIRRCHFLYTDYGIHGRTTQALYANVFTVEANNFALMGVAGIGNAGEAWQIIGNTFTARRDGKAGAYYQPDTISCKATSFIGNWCGDPSASGGTAFRWNGLGLAFHGNFVAGVNGDVAGGRGLTIHAGFVAEGLDIAGNFFYGGQYGVDFASAAHRGLRLGGNMFTVANPVTGQGSLGSSHLAANDSSGGAVADVLTAPNGLTITGAATLPTVSSINIGGAGVGTTLKRVVASSVAVNPASIAANTKGGVAVTITGVAAGDKVIFEPPASLDAGLAYIGCRVTGADTVTIYLLNYSAGAVDGANLSWDYEWHDLT